MFFEITGEIVLPCEPDIKYLAIDWWRVNGLGVAGMARTFQINNNTIRKWDQRRESRCILWKYEGRPKLIDDKSDHAIFSWEAGNTNVTDDGLKVILWADFIISHIRGHPLVSLNYITTICKINRRSFGLNVLKYQWNTKKPLLEKSNCCHVVRRRRVQRILLQIYE